MMDLAEVKKFEQQNTTTLSLSQLILIGCQWNRQGYMNFMTADGRTCAIGAAQVAAHAHRINPFVLDRLVDKADAAFHLKFKNGIFFANDVLRWSRESIAQELKLLGH
jgi:hypothetical protein